MTKTLPQPKWNPRDWAFEKLQVGDELVTFDSLGYFRTKATRYFKSTRRKTYTTFSIEREGRKGLRLVRMDDLPADR
jgi:hypothetical protein